LSTHLSEPLDIHRRAEESHLSPYHFHRIFAAMLGETLNDTLRRRRLHTAVFVFTGPYSALEKPRRWLYETWLPQNAETLADASPYEEYLNDTRSATPVQLRTSICIPLK
jgi:AraC-like DNA-binding protein